MQHPKQLVTPFINQCLITIKKINYLDNCLEPLFSKIHKKAFQYAPY